MRRYIAKINIPQEWCQLETGILGEVMFEHWFKLNYQGENIFKQKADRDYQGIDFADEKGFTYQVKCTRARSFTFNCCLDDLSHHLTASFYVFIQIQSKDAYIENIYTREEILNLAKQSFKSNKQCFVYSKDLQQQKLF